MSARSQSFDPTTHPVYWFAILAKAVDEGRHREAAHAQAHLSRLGVEVRYGRPPRPQRRGDARHEAK
jgi:hypothetical protein